MSRCECAGKYVFDWLDLAKPDLGYSNQVRFEVVKCAHCREVEAIAREAIAFIEHSKKVLKEHGPLCTLPVGEDDLLARAERVLGKG